MGGPDLQVSAGPGLFRASDQKTEELQHSSGAALVRANLREKLGIGWSRDLRYGENVDNAHADR